MADYRYKPGKEFKINKRLVKYVLLVIVLLTILSVSLFIKNKLGDRSFDFTNYPNELLLGDKFVPIKLLAVAQEGMILGDDCRQLLIPITSDQLFSISNGLTRDFSRPLTHDIYKSSLDHYGITPVRFSIDKYEDELWYATLRLQNKFDVLDLDVRPSDGVAMAVRYNLTIFIDELTLDKKAKNVCQTV